MHKGYIKTAAFLGALSVMLGAFAAHKLKEILTEQSLNTFETGVRYQVYHVFALALTALIYKEFRNKFITTAGILFMLGIGFFSGSLYLLTYFSAKAIVGYEWVGAITPIGGLFFITGWLCLSLGVKYK
jgi:uncharacterized membrane protein YgdD (TMEM256/DUF423 family)